MLTATYIITQHPFFAGLAADHQKYMIKHASECRFDSETYIFHQGEPAEKCYLLGRGTVSVEIATPGQDPIQIQLVGEGELLGLSWVFPPHIWQFDARVLQPIHALVFDADALRRLCEKDHELAYQLMKRYGQAVLHRLQTARQRLLEEQDAHIKPKRFRHRTVHG